jgi:hypothetical protein
VSVAASETIVVEAPRRASLLDYLFHGILFAGCFVVLVLAIVFRVDGPDKVIVPIVNQPLPPSCTMKTLTGYDCPGCGLTRSFVSLAHGNLLRSFSFNVAGPLLFSMMAFQLVYRPWQLWRIRNGVREFDLSNLGGWSLGIVAIVLILQWAIRAGISMSA